LTLFGWGVSTFYCVNPPQGGLNNSLGGPLSVHFESLAAASKHSSLKNQPGLQQFNYRHWLSLIQRIDSVHFHQCMYQKVLQLCFQHIKYGQKFANFPWLCHLLINHFPLKPCCVNRFLLIMLKSFSNLLKQVSHFLYIDCLDSGVHVTSATKERNWVGNDGTCLFRTSSNRRMFSWYLRMYTVWGSSFTKHTSTGRSSHNLLKPRGVILDSGEYFSQNMLYVSFNVNRRKHFCNLFLPSLLLNTTLSFLPSACQDMSSRMKKEFTEFLTSLFKRGIVWLVEPSVGMPCCLDSCNITFLHLRGLFGK